MVSTKHGKITSYKTVFFEESTNSKIQIAQYEKKGTPAVNLVKFLTPNNKKQGLLVIPLSFNLLGHYIDELVKLYGKAEVEQELNIKIGGEIND